jgi:thioester reductase-like protein
VRARNSDEGVDRVRQAVRDKRLDDHVVAATVAAQKLKVFAASIGERKFGLSDREYDELVSNVDSIVHIAAEVNFGKKFEELEKVNVGSVREVLKLAVASIPPKAVQYVSTLSVFGSKIKRTNRVSAATGKPKRAPLKEIDSIGESAVDSGSCSASILQ